MRYALGYMGQISLVSEVEWVSTTAVQTIDLVCFCFDLTELPRGNGEVNELVNCHDGYDTPLVLQQTSPTEGTAFSCGMSLLSSQGRFPSHVE